MLFSTSESEPENSGTDPALVFKCKLPYKPGGRTHWTNITQVP